MLVSWIRLARFEVADQERCRNLRPRPSGYRSATAFEGFVAAIEPRSRTRVE
jgi:hypothetical protein